MRKVTFPLGGHGRTVTLIAHNAAVDRPFVTKMAVNGQAYDSPWLPFLALEKKENMIEFWMASKPNEKWGSKPPPSFDARPQYLDGSDKKSPKLKGKTGSR